jgi:protein-S-isoprenylcysteine O-methyltransferase Ste14
LPQRAHVFVHLTYFVRRQKRLLNHVDRLLYVRHPIYTALIAIAVGTTLVFRSYLLLGVAALSIVTHLCGQLPRRSCSAPPRVSATSTGPTHPAPAGSYRG